MPTLRELIDANPDKPFRVKISDNPPIFRDNQPGDELPVGDATYGLPGKKA